MDESAEQGGTVGADEEPSSAHPTADELTAGASSRQPAIPSSQGGTEEQGYEAAEQEGNSGESAQGDEPVVGAPAEPALDRSEEAHQDHGAIMCNGGSSVLQQIALWSDAHASGSDEAFQEHHQSPSAAQHVAPAANKEPAVRCTTSAPALSGKRSANCSLGLAIRKKDPLLLARAAVQEHEMQLAHDLAVAQRLERRIRRDPRLTKSTPHSLVVQPARGQALTPPPGWRREWLAEDPKEVAAADAALERLAAQQVAAHRNRFKEELALRRQQDKSRSVSPVSRRSRSPSPAREREARVLAQAHQRYTEKQAALEHKWQQKHEQANARLTQLTARMHAENIPGCTATDRSLALATQRAELIRGICASGLRVASEVKEARRLAVCQRKDAYMAAQTQARSTTTLANLSQAQQRHQQLKDAQALQQQERLQVVNHAVAVASERHTAHCRTVAERAHSSRQQRFAVAAERAAEFKRLNDTAGARMSAEWARKDAVIAARRNVLQEREREAQQKQLAGLLARHYATEYEHQALVTKKLPTVTPHDAKVMARYGIQAQ